jgi:hypothetical protein
VVLGNTEKTGAATFSDRTVTISLSKGASITSGENLTIGANLTITGGVTAPLAAGGVTIQNSSVLRIVLDSEPVGGLKRSVFSVPVCTYTTRSSTAFSAVSVEAAFPNSQCYTLGEPQQDFGSTALSVTLSISRLCTTNPAPTNTDEGTTPAAADVSSGGLSRGALIGVASAAAVVGTIIVLVIVGFMVARRKRLADLHWATIAAKQKGDLERAGGLDV